MATRPSPFFVLGLVVPPAILLACGTPFSATGGDGGASSSTGPSGSGPSSSGAATSTSSSSGSSSHASSGSSTTSSGAPGGDAGSCPTKCADDHPVGYAEFEKYELTACGCNPGSPCMTPCKATCGSPSMIPDSTCNACLQGQENTSPMTMCTAEAVATCTPQGDCDEFLTCIEGCGTATPGG